MKFQASHYLFELQKTKKKNRKTELEARPNKKLQNKSSNKT